MRIKITPGYYCCQEFYHFFSFLKSVILYHYDKDVLSGFNI